MCIFSKPELGSGFYQFEEECPSYDEHSILSGHSLMIAWDFWDSWIDECNHGFPGFYEGISKEAWPELAKLIVEKLMEDGEIDDPLILKHFVIEKKSPLIEKVKNIFQND